MLSLRNRTSEELSPLKSPTAAAWYTAEEPPGSCQWANAAVTPSVSAAGFCSHVRVATEPIWSFSSPVPPSAVVPSPAELISRKGGAALLVELKTSAPKNAPDRSTLHEFKNSNHAATAVILWVIASAFPLFATAANHSARCSTASRRRHTIDGAKVKRLRLFTLPGPGERSRRRPSSAPATKSHTTLRGEAASFSIQRAPARYT
jgi:hypothetical protein